MKKLDGGDLNVLLDKASERPCRYAPQWAYTQDLDLLRRIGGRIVLKSLQEEFPDMDKDQILEALALGVKVPVMNATGYDSRPWDEKFAFKQELVRSLANILAIAQELRIPLVQPLRSHIIDLTGKGGNEDEISFEQR